MTGVGKGEYKTNGMDATLCADTTVLGFRSPVIYSSRLGLFGTLDAGDMLS